MMLCTSNDTDTASLVSRSETICYLNTSSANAKLIYIIRKPMFFNKIMNYNKAYNLLHMFLLLL